MGDTLKVVQEMEKALGRSEEDLSPWFHEDFVWEANYGSGIKYGLDEFNRNWWDPFRVHFGEMKFRTERYLEDGDWAACYGACHAVLIADFMGVRATGQRIRIPYIDFWRVEDGRIAENRVSVDFAAVLAQLGRDVFDGHGWDQNDPNGPAPFGREVNA